MKILGILNITDDSFSDGGKYLAPGAALAQGRELLADGADILDIGAAASNPDARRVAPETEIARLGTVLPAFKERKALLSIDSSEAKVQRWALGQGVDYLNDIHGFAEPSLYPELASSKAKLIVMHMVQGGGVAVSTDVPKEEIFERVSDFFEKRLARLQQAGIARERLILDPGMGQFVGRDAENSLILLRRLAELKARFGLSLLISVSRKGFLRRLVHDGDPLGLPVLGASLAAELHAVLQGADYVRTHSPGALIAAIKIRNALAAG
ncbi:MAG: dihydropteroate synthase [Rhizomicrobium sp.]